MDVLEEQHGPGGMPEPIPSLAEVRECMEVPPLSEGEGGPSLAKADKVAPPPPPKSAAAAKASGGAAGGFGAGAAKKKGGSKKKKR